MSTLSHCRLKIIRYANLKNNTFRRLDDVESRSLKNLNKIYKTRQKKQLSLPYWTMRETFNLDDVSPDGIL